MVTSRAGAWLRGSARRSVIVIGSGIAGLTAALHAADAFEVTLVTKRELTESSTRYAQGGIAAALFDDDSVAAHVLDTMRAGDGLGEYEAIQALCAEGPDRVRELIALGVAFDREHGRLARGLEAAHSTPRVLHVGGDATGAAIERALASAVGSAPIEIVEHAFLADLLIDAGRVIGVRTVEDGARVDERYADAVVLATGGAGAMYAHTSNPALATGDGVAAAWRAGARLRDLEFYQFHPTTLAAAAGMLVSEAVRGEGAVLLNRAGERFMCDVHPAAELAPRDVVARAIATEMAAQEGEPVLLDATALGRVRLAERFPTIDAGTRAAGFDWSAEPIPVTPAAHYWMGGVATDVWGRTSMPGLFAVGEVACTGVHGANRLASNSLLEGLVFAHRAVRALAGDDRAPALIPDQPARAAGTTRPERALSPHEMSGDGAGDGRNWDRHAVQALMWDAVGLQRSGEGLRRAAATLETWTAQPAASITQREDANLLQLARLMVDAALAREESRGAHYRTDFPAPATAAEPFPAEESLAC